MAFATGCQHDRRDNPRWAAGAHVLCPSSPLRQNPVARRKTFEERQGSIVNAVPYVRDDVVTGSGMPPDLLPYADELAESSARTAVVLLNPCFERAPGE